MKSNNIYLDNLNSYYAIYNLNQIQELIDNKDNLPLKDKELYYAIKELYYSINIIINNGDIKDFNKNDINKIINLCIYISNENTRRYKAVVDKLRVELKNKPKDNYDNMSKEELIALLRNK